MTGRFPIEDVSPVVSCGRYPAKAVVDEPVPVSARAYREGHDALGCNVVWHGPDGASRPFTRMRPGEPGQDRWHATIRPDAVGSWTFSVEAFQDPYLTWQNAVTKKIAAGQGPEDLANDLAEGARVLDRRPGPRAGRRPAAGSPTRSPRWSTPTCRWRSGSTRRWRWPTCSGSTRSGSWSPPATRTRSGLTASGRSTRPGTSSSPAPRGRSAGAPAGPAPSRPPPSGCRGSPRWASTCSTCRRSTRSAGSTARAATTRSPPGRTDVGSPWAIGAAEGGHDAIHPDLGTPADFRRLRRRRRRHRAWRWRWTWRCSARRTTRGSPSTRSGSPPGPTAASRTRRTRRRSTRTSTRSTSTTTRRASGPRCCGWCCTGSARASGSSGWTTRTPSRSTSGTG